MNLGDRIKKIRSHRKLTLEELAKRTGFSASFLSQIERNITSPSIASLRKIASSLNVKIGHFFEEKIKRVTLVKKEKRVKFPCKGSKAIGEILASGALNIKMEPLLFSIEPGGETGKELNSHDGEEFGIVLEGKVEFLLRKDKYIMNEGDSISFASIEPHKFINIGNEKAVVLWVVFSPTW